MRKPGAAAVVDRDLELQLDLRRDLLLDVAVLALALQFGSRDDFEIRENAGGIGQTVGRGRRSEAEARDLEIDAVRKRASPRSRRSTSDRPGRDGRASGTK